MTITITDPATLAALEAAPPGSEVRGPDGRSFGRLIPPSEIYIPEFGVTVAEMDRICDDPNTKWVTGEQVMERLNSLRDQK